MTARRDRIASGTAFRSPRELAVRFTDSQGYFVSEASVYRLLKARDLIASPAFIVINAADAFKDKTTAPNQLWQTDFTYLKVIGWGWFYLSTVLWGSPELVDTFAKLRRERRGVEWAKDVVILRMSSSEKRWPCW